MKFYWMIANVRKVKREIHRRYESMIGRERVEGAYGGFTLRKRRYHAWPLFQLFLNQVASGMSCGEAIAWGIGRGLLPVKTSPKTSAYCNAKARMAEEPIEEIMKEVGGEVEGCAHTRSRIFGRNVKVVDGTSIQLPDTKSNQERYPQPEGQKPGCGQPVMRVVALMGLAGGAIVECAVDAYRVSERELFRRLWPSLREGDMVLGDRGFSSFAEAASLLNMGVDFIFRQKQGSLKNKGLRKIGRDEWIVTWERPKRLGDWVDPVQLPARITVRAIRFRTSIRGFRSREIILFTSLIDRKKYPKKTLMDLYYRRWEMELRIRDVKTTMGLELLRSKTPSGCRKELWMGLIAYNLIRGIMLDASLRGKLPVSRISFKTTLGCLDAFAAGTITAHNPERAYLVLLDHLIEARLPIRPPRIEPRKRKRRPKNNYPLLTAPRNAARIEACNA
jgi:hypothetical protein